MAREISNFQAQLAGYIPFLAESHAKDAGKVDDVLTKICLRDLTYRRRFFYGSIIGTAALLATAYSSTNHTVATATAVGFVFGILVIIAENTKLSFRAEVFRRTMNNT